jgi:hypothetical protein
LHFFTEYELVTAIRPWASLFLLANPLLNAIICMVYFRRLRNTVSTFQNVLTLI